MTTLHRREPEEIETREEATAAIVFDLVGMPLEDQRAVLRAVRTVKAVREAREARGRLETVSEEDAAQ